MSKFRKGDIVVCVDNSEVFRHLTIGNVYIIQYSNRDNLVFVVDDRKIEEQYYESRFELLLDTGDGSTSYKPKSSCIILEV